MKTIIFIIAFILVGCGQNQQQNKVESTKSIKAIKKIEDLRGVRIKCLAEIGAEYCTTGAIAILFYTISDCHSCVERGYKILDFMQTTKSDFKVAVIVNDPDITTKRTQYQYSGEIFNDNDDKLIKEFSYLYTPFVLFVNEGNLMSGYYIDNQKEFENDIEYICELLNINKKEGK